MALDLILFGRLKNVCLASYSVILKYWVNLFFYFPFLQSQSDGADNIIDSTVFVKKENVSEGSVFVKWDEPISPNGLIVSYHMEYAPINDKV